MITTQNIKAVLKTTTSKTTTSNNRQAQLHQYACLHIATRIDAKQKELITMGFSGNTYGTTVSGVNKQTLQGENNGCILVVEDAFKSRQMIALQLGRLGYTVICADNGLHALELIRRQGLPRLVLLDISLPDQDGFAVAQEIQMLGDVPIVLLVSPTDKIAVGSRHLMGIRDYLLKPFVVPELLASVEAALRDYDAPTPHDQEFWLDAGVSINFAQQYLHVDGQKILLTPTEARLLHLLYRNRGRVVSPGYLVHKAWRDDQTGSLGALWVHIRRLRNKLERRPESPEYLVTVRGQGYSLQSDPAGTACRDAACRHAALGQ
jgi:DNA-binding response OmpR family regulator